MTRLFAVLVGCVLLAAPSEAALLLSATINGVPVCVVDNNTGCGHGLNLTDTDGALNSILLAPQSVGGVFFEGTAAQATAGPTVNLLDSSSLRVRNDSGALVTATVAVSATGFLPPVSHAFASASGTWQGAVGGSTIDMAWFNDPNNAQGALTPATRPGVLLTTFADTAAAPVDAWSTGTLGPFAVTDLQPFSMTLGFDITLQPGAELISRGMNQVKPIPEPATLALVGVAGLGLYLRRRRHDAD